MTLRADAQGYQTFPGGVRQALPVDVTGATGTDVTLSKADAFLLDTSLTDVGLIALEAGAPTASIYGTAELPDTVRGTLVVAELSPTEGYTAIADLEGSYRIFNLPAGTYTVRGYRREPTSSLPRSKTISSCAIPIRASRAPTSSIRPSQRARPSI